MIDHLIHKIAVVRHDDRTSFEVPQIFLQHIQRDDIQVVRRFVEHKKVRYASRPCRDINGVFLPTQLVNVIMLFFRSEKEIVQEL